MNHSFNVEYATTYGLEEAIIIENFIFWITKNRANEKHQHEVLIDGVKEIRTFTYNSAKALTELFPYMNERRIYRVMESLVEQGVLIKGNYSSNGYDRTLWYAFKMENAFCGVGKSIYQNRKMDSPNKETHLPNLVNHDTDINTDIKPDGKPNINKEPIQFHQAQKVKAFHEHHKKHLASKKQTELKQTFHQVDELGRELDWDLDKYDKLIFWKPKHEFWMKTTDTAHYLLKALKDIALNDIPTPTRTLDDELMEKVNEDNNQNSLDEELMSKFV